LARRAHEKWQPQLGGFIKHFSSERCDWLFVLVADGRCWFIPSGVVDATAALRLGGPKYEVEPGGH
jgi:hypothetical protein